jgi:hypothetical protein
MAPDKIDDILPPVVTVLVLLLMLRPKHHGLKLKDW